jgi:integrase
MTKHQRMTAAFVESARPPKGQPQIDYFDHRERGLSLRVSAGGAKSWTLFYRVFDPAKGKRVQIRYPVGRFPTVSLAAARQRAGEIRDLLDHGKDPKVEADRQRREEQRQRADTVASVAYQWLKSIGAKIEEADAGQARSASNGKVKPKALRSADTIKRIMDRLVIPMLGARPIRDIAKRDLIELRDAIAAANGVVMSNRAMAWVKRMFRWAAEEDIIDNPPIIGLKNVHTEEARERTLSDSELVAVWRASEKLGRPFAGFFRLLILSGQRREEIASLRWSEVNEHDSLIELSGERYKTGVPHVTPLVTEALAIVADQPRIAGCDYVFTATGRSAISGFSGAKERLDAEIAKTRGDPLPAWRIHDLRRTCRTNLPRLGIAADVAERVVGHTLQGVRRVYDKYDYLPQKRHALETWARHVFDLVGGKPSNVTPLRAAQ